MPLGRSRFNRAVAGIVLAAGRSERFGGNKLLEKLCGRTLIELVLSRLPEGRYSQVVVVTSPEVFSFLQGRVDDWVELVANRSAQAQLSDSIRRGVETIRRPCGMMMILGDMPLVEKVFLSEMIELYDGSSIVVPTHQGRRGNPVIFPWCLREKLMNLKGDFGGKCLINSHPEMVKTIRARSDSVLFDVDHPCDLLSADQRLRIME